MSAAIIYTAKVAAAPLYRGMPCTDLGVTQFDDGGAMVRLESVGMSSHAHVRSDDLRKYAAILIEAADAFDAQQAQQVAA